jgi:hypothetical protein
LVSAMLDILFGIRAHTGIQYFKMHVTL